MSFALKMPRQVHCGNDCELKLAEFAQKYANVCVFTDMAVRRTTGAQKMLGALQNAGVNVQILDGLAPEPTCDQAQETINAFCDTRAVLIVAMGGGSVMDIAKLASRLPPRRNTPCVTCWKTPALAKKIIPTVMIPTTAGTGAEATPNSIVTVPEKALKVGIVNEAMIPDLVLLDGDMIAELPAPIAASTGVDALCHAIECYTSNKATAFSDLFAMEALRLIFRNLERACADPTDIDAKNCHATGCVLWAGVAITASGTTAVHAFKLSAGRTLPHTARRGKRHHADAGHGAFNAPACIPAFARVMDALEPDPTLGEAEKAQKLLDRMQEMLVRLDIPTSLKPYGITAQDMDPLVEAGMAVQRLLVNNPRPVTAEDARRFVRRGSVRR